MIIAGIACLLCLPMIFVLTRPVAWFVNAPWAGWLLLPFFTLAPIAVAYAVLSRSSWHRESPAARRVPSMIFSSCIIYAVDLIVIGLMLAATCLVVALTRVVGGN